MVNMTNKIVEYKDLIVFHPGQYVEELIEEYNLTQKEFAERLGVSEIKLGKLVNGEESIRSLYSTILLVIFTI